MRTKRLIIVDITETLQDRDGELIHTNGYEKSFKYWQKRKAKKYKNSILDNLVDHDNSAINGVFDLSDGFWLVKRVGMSDIEYQNRQGDVLLYSLSIRKIYRH